MIRVILRGRTGNILFQYAFGRYLADKYGVPLVLDASWYNSQGWKEVSYLLRMPLKAKVVRRLPLMARLLRKISGKHYWEYACSNVIKELPNDATFNDEILNTGNHCVLLGYFQSHKFFPGMEEILRKELLEMLDKSCIPRDESFEKYRIGLMETNSVAVHVRRGDYLTLPDFNVCDLSYYDDSMRKMRAIHADARFFIFSDDHDWCVQRFTGKDTTVVNTLPSSTNPLCELLLMSLASHHIIANSSYSWWAAWLGNKPDQQVFFPDRWFTGSLKAPMKDKIWK